MMRLEAAGYVGEKEGASERDRERKNVCVCVGILNSVFSAFLLSPFL